MLVMLAVGIPLYICATASTPIAAMLILKGVSPGAALVFLLAGPATNTVTITVIGKELGNVRRAGPLIGGLGIVVGAVIRMAPTIGVVHVRFGGLFPADDDCCPGVHDPKELFFTYSVSGGGRGKRQPGKVVGQMNGSPISFLNENSGPQKSSPLGCFSHGGHFIQIG